MAQRTTPCSRASSLKLAACVAATASVWSVSPAATAGEDDVGDAAEDEPPSTTDDGDVEDVPDERPDEAASFEGDPLAEESDSGTGVYDEESDEPDGYSGPFNQGSIGLSVLIGSASIGDRGYLVLGGGLSYYVLDGVAVGLDADAWLFDDPTVYTTTPQLQYVFYYVPVVHPYVGAFYRHYFLTDDYDDLDSIGGRVGAYVLSGGGFLGLGAIYERFLACDDSYWVCDGWYPELTIGFSL